MLSRLTGDSGTLISADTARADDETARCVTLEIAEGEDLATGSRLGEGDFAKSGVGTETDLLADRDGPSLDATSADLSKNFLYWYFAFSEKKVNNN